MEIIKEKDVKLGCLVKILKKGSILVVPTDTVYGIICDAKNKEAIDKIFKIKKRNRKKPISIFVKDIKMAKKLAVINKTQGKFLKKAWPGKTIIVLKAREKFPKGIVSQWGKIGLRMPNYKLLSKILKEFKKPLAQTSANITGEFTPTTIKDISKQFEENIYQLDVLVDVGKLSGEPSTVIDLTQSLPRVLRP